MQNFCQLIVLWVAISAHALRCSICVKGKKFTQIQTERRIKIIGCHVYLLLTRLMRVSYCRAEPDVAVTIPPLRKMPCSSRSFLMPRTWESSVWRSRSWRYFSLEPQMNSRSFLTCRLTNGVCWIIRYWKIIKGGWCMLNYSLITLQHRPKANYVHYLWQEIEPGVIKDRRWNAWVGICDFLDLVRQSEDHLGEELRVRFKHISSVALRNTHNLKIFLYLIYYNVWVRASFLRTGLYLDILAQEEGAHVWGWGRSVGFKELTGGRWLLLTLLGLPELQQGFEHMQAVVYRSHAEQSGSCCVGDERRRLARKQKWNWII